MEQTADAEFWIDERPDEDGRLRLELVGELDIAGATRLEERLQALAQGSDPAVLDLHRLHFVDSSGLPASSAPSPTPAATTAASCSRGPLAQVRQIIDLLELHDLFWPPARRPPAPRRCASGQPDGV
jgi:hypothetical protein